MEQIIVYKRNGAERYKLNNYAKLCTVKSAEQKRELLGEDTVTIKTESAEPLDFAIGDYVIVYGDIYTLNKLPEPKKTGERLFETSFIFEGLQYKLLDAQYRSADALGKNPTANFPLVANMELAMQVLINNINRVGKDLGDTWVLGDCIETEHKELTFNNENCLAVLQRLCGEFETEFEIEALGNKKYRLHIRKAGSLFGATFTFGKGGGIYTLKRKNVNSSNVVTKLYVEGGTKNIKVGYRDNATRLRLAINEESYIQQSTAVAAMGIKEGGKIFEDIYPHRTGVITSLGADRFTFVDKDMFDLNEKESDGKTTKWLIDGTSAKIKFTKGNIAGYEFEVKSYDTKTHTFVIKEYEDSRGFKIPSTDAAYQIEVDDEYVLIDIIMPNNPYVVDAEAALLDAGTKYYEQNSQPKVEYELEISSMFLNRKYNNNGAVINVFKLGDYIPVKDADINVDKAIRVKGFTRDVATDPYKYKLTISDTVDISIIEKLIADNIEQEKIININNLTDVAKARSNWRTTQELLNMVFDGDGYFDAENIRPNSIETLMLSVGNRAGQFILRNITFVANAVVGSTPNPNVFQTISNSGVLIHYAIEEKDRTWNIASATHTLSSSSSAYYIYAKCSKTGNACTIISSTNKLSVEQDAGYYYFLIGVLSSSYNGYRDFVTTYGATRITGRTINCGRIESIDKQTYFDLDNSEIGGRIVFKSNGETKTLDELGAESLETKDFINNTLPSILDEIQAQLDGQIEQFFETYNPTTSNAPANTWTTAALKENHLGDLFYNTSTGKVWRWVKEGNVYKWQELQDTELAQALALANEALALAKDKNRIFTTTPFTPYEKGDLWVQGASGGIMRCKTTRLSGAYSSSDWERASNYTDDSGLNNFINGAYNSQINDLVNQIDGKIETWFQTADPSTAWTTAAVRAKHVGDMWYSSTTKQLKRYSSSYTWTTIEDAKAIAAYEAASKAQDTADGKRRVFVATPYPPYDVGDLWVNGVDLRRCATKRASGSYVANDWVIAVHYDNTKTTIDGGIVTSGTVQLAGSGGSILAGITGDGTAATSIRIWAGASFENRATAPFRVRQNGSVVMTDADITGVINATSGTFSGTLKGVTGSFRSLNCVDSNGKVVGSITFGSDGNIWFQGGLYHQASSTPFYMSNVFVRGTFGAYTRNALVIYGNYGYYYPRGLYDSSNRVYVSLSQQQTSNNKTYYIIPLYGQSGNAAGMPVDLVIINVSSGTYRYAMSRTAGKKVTVVNANDKNSDIYIYSCGKEIRHVGGEIADWVCLDGFLSPAPASNVVGNGWLVCASRDNTWS
ncbi:hypothetical protein M2451_002649 [Dysgonomonas sp. PFB1-18]|uniref:hypothetical protein n=1 Tax=unclassified Dysgonomonas TaxID=2630389 RepID=UPI0024734B33|nr:MULTISPECIES: hypothetical protein [unclassified Dysgonomonas]MDH6308130.1 hypothetical protein [Dysgonomonas sp. PF1-14]MDH6339669.1 hypothetical protein [Dysgonomonas sp. PF1-16]MDH6381320.1 hypothetical protein [Dysgonomonas sp. PFB1-18]MDH6398532.1 hypothetical protein [Dysgonomonas sp. PF1-23]